MMLPRHETITMPEPNREASYEAVIASDPAEARRVQEHIEELLRLHHFEDREIFSVKLALEEAIVNAIKHGNGMDRAKKVTISYHVRGDRFEVLIKDEGRGFDPEDVPDPMDVENLERPCGRGLLLMKHYMTEVVFHSPGNRLAMCKVRGASNLNGHHLHGH
jgi:serine/threonine-protein kinase RsbW